MEEENDKAAADQPTRAALADIVPAAWYDQPDLWVWMSCYHTMRLTKATLSNGPRILSFNDAIAMIFYGSPVYFPESTIAVQSTDVPVFSTHVQATPIQAPEGCYMMLILRFQNGEEHEYPLRVRELTLRSILTTVLGENIAYRRLFQTRVKADGTSANLFSEFFRNPYSDPEPDISDESLNLAMRLEAAIENLPNNDAERVRLSLRWHGQAKDAQGPDAFINQWVALESLGMSDRSNIRPLEEALARSYAIPLSEARARFHVGRLFGFRSEILHKGIIPPIPSTLTDYMRALYKDILWEKLAITSEHAAGLALQNAGVDLLSLLDRD